MNIRFTYKSLTRRSNVEVHYNTCHDMESGALAEQCSMSEGLLLKDFQAGLGSFRDGAVPCLGTGVSDEIRFEHCRGGLWGL